MIPVDSIESKFTFVLAAAKRARQLQAGANPLLQSHWRKPTRLAIEEILHQAVQFALPEPEGEEEAGGRKKKSRRGK
ncbi:MAG: DNA-directed RNA polymerase subunit omega [Terriglobia bacterium]